MNLDLDLDLDVDLDLDHFPQGRHLQLSNTRTSGLPPRLQVHV